MSGNLSRLFTMLADLSTPKLGLASVRSRCGSESLVHSNAAKRIFCSSTQGQQHREKEEEEEDREVSTFSGNKQSSAEENEDDEGEGGDHVNKLTGEVGGPRGPEPTRFGDWERNGRCSDF